MKTRTKENFINLRTTDPENLLWIMRRGMADILRDANLPMHIKDEALVEFQESERRLKYLIDQNNEAAK